MLTCEVTGKEKASDSEEEEVGGNAETTVNIAELEVEEVELSISKWLIVLNSEVPKSLGVPQSECSTCTSLDQYLLPTYMVARFTRFRVEESGNIQLPTCGSLNTVLPFFLVERVVL